MYQCLSLIKIDIYVMTTDYFQVRRARHNPWLIEKSVWYIIRGFSCRRSSIKHSSWRWRSCIVYKYWTHGWIYRM